MSNAQKIRVAIALIALRYKPKEQSYESYVLDLRAKYPDGASSEAAVCKCHISVEPDGAWRERAMSLEERLKTLQETYDREHLELEALRTIPTSESANAAPARPPSKKASHVGNKKQNNKKTRAHTPEQEVADAPKLADLLKRLSSKLPELSISDGLFQALHALDALALRADSSSIQCKELIFLAAKRAIGAFAPPLVSPHPSIHPATPKSGIVETMTELLYDVLNLVVPLLCQTSKKRKREDPGHHNHFLDALLGHLATSLLVPLVRSFSAVSLGYLSGLLRSSAVAESTVQNLSATSPSPATDIRPNVFKFLQVALQALQELCSTHSGNATLITSTHSVYDLLALTALRELDELYPPFSDDPSPSNTGTSHASSTMSSNRTPINHDRSMQHRDPPNADRLQKLARKDALWYLCGVLHLAISAASASPSRTGIAVPVLPASASSNPSLSASGSGSSLSTGRLHDGSSTLSAPPSGSGAGTNALNSGGHPQKSTGPSWLDAQSQPQPQGGHSQLSSVGRFVPQHKILAEAVCTALSALLRRLAPFASSHAKAVDAMSGRALKRRRRALYSETERAMLLAVAERVWMSQD